MQADPQSTPTAPAGPLGDDWLTRDPESFGDAIDTEKDTIGLASGLRRHWRRVGEDLMLYTAGISTGLMVVALAWLLMQVVATPRAVGTPAGHTDEASPTEQLAANRDRLDGAVIGFTERRPGP